MSRRSLAVVAACLLGALQLAAASPARAQAPSAATVPPLVAVSSKWLDPRLVELSFADPLTNPPMPQVRVRVMLPADYSTSTAVYPTLYLLHGAGDTAASWSSNDDGQESLEAFTAKQEVVIVMPDGGANDIAGWYSDWYNAGAFGPPMWESFHIEQLIPYIESHYRVRTDRGGRVVAGLSMGGFGAYSYAARHPDLFASAFSFSGFLDTAGIPYLEPAALDALHANNGTPTSAIWGDWNGNEVRWRGHNPADLVGNLHDVQLWMTTGQGVPGGPAPDDNSPTGLATESAVFATNQSFDAKATLAGVSPTFLPYPQGGHNWWHWQNDLHTAWPLILQSFATSHPAPATFDYESIEPSFSVWGWSVQAHRDATEFLTMQSMSPQGGTLVGSGSMDLATPPAYTPHHRYHVAVAGSTASTSTPVVTADDAGRLHITVALGPSHTLQQYTAQERVAEASNPSYWETAHVAITPLHGEGGGHLAAASSGGASIAGLPLTSAAPTSDTAATLAMVALLAPPLLRRRKRAHRGNAR